MGGFPRLAQVSYDIVGRVFLYSNSLVLGDA